jgi:hypothetical protein
MTTNTTEQPIHQQQGHLSDPDLNGIQGLELTEVEKQEREADGEYVPVPVKGETVRVKPQKDWRMSDMRLLNQGDFDGFAEALIHPDDVDGFLDQDLTLEEFREFTEEAARQAGDGLGKSSGRSRSSRNTRRR